MMTAVKDVPAVAYSAIFSPAGPPPMTTKSTTSRVGTAAAAQSVAVEAGRP